MRSHHNLILVVLLIIFGFSPAKPAIAQVETTVQFQPPPEEEQPKSTEGAASRQTSKCDANSSISESTTGDPHLTAVVPQGNYGLTTSERPNLWVYLPETSAKQAILSIREEGNTPHWQQSVDLRGEAGVTSVKLSNNAPILEIGKNYQWAVILVCGGRPNPNDPVVTSWIKRVAEKNTQSSLTSKLELVSNYAQQGIWYDALNILVSQKSSLNNWHDLWSEYLESAGLNQITGLPVIENPLLPK